MSEAAVSMVERRESPILTEMSCAPGATPLISGLSGKWPAAMPATWVPCAPERREGGKAGGRKGGRGGGREEIKSGSRKITNTSKCGLQLRLAFIAWPSAGLLRCMHSVLICRDVCHYGEYYHVMHATV